MTQEVEIQDLELYTFGKVRPQNDKLEKSVIGAVLIDTEAFYKVMDVLNWDDFYYESNQAAWRCFQTLSDKSMPIDLVTATEEIKSNGDLEKIITPYFLIECTNLIASSAHIETHCDLIKQHSCRRKMIDVCLNAVKDSYDDSVNHVDLIDKTEQAIFDIAGKSMTGRMEDSGTIASRAIKAYDEASKKEDGLTGVPSGFVDLDRLTGGWQNSDLIILAARPGMGKTSFALKLAMTSSMDFDKPVAVFSLEMSKLQMIQRMGSIDAQVSGNEIRRGRLSEEDYAKYLESLEKLSNSKIHIDDTPSLQLVELRAKCRRLKMKHDIQLIVVDYLQLMKNKGQGSREQEISSISQGLKAIAKELEVPVIALAQLSRAVELRGGTKRPQLSDLRESGAIEQDADMVNFLYRPEYYQIIEDAEGQSLVGVCEIIIAKNRHGATGTKKIKFIKEFSRFEDVDQYEQDSNSVPDLNPNITNIARSSRNNNDEDIPF